MELQWLRIPDSALRFSLKSYLYKVNKHEIITFKLAAAIHKRIHYYRTAADIQYCSLSNMCYSVLHKLPLLKGTGCSSQNQGTQRMKWIGSLDQQGWTQPPFFQWKLNLSSNQLSLQFEAIKTLNIAENNAKTNNQISKWEKSLLAFLPCILKHLLILDQTCIKWKKNIYFLCI